MKRNIFFALTTTAVMLTATSCEDMLDTRSDSQVSTEAVFDNAENAEKAIVGIYNSMFEERAFRNTLVGVMMTNTDAEVNSSTKPTASDQGQTDVAMYKFTTSLSGNGFNASSAGDPWSRLFKSVELCNQAIAGIRKFGDSNDAQLNYLLGEALTLRAFFYDYMIRIWGDVPARFEPVTNQTIYIQKTDRREIYEQLMEDLEVAETLVPWAGKIQQTQTVERVNKEFVKGLRARIAITMAGKALLPTGGRGSLDYLYEDASTRQQLYKIAADETAEIIANTGFTLASSYEDIFKQQCQDIITVGRESIFELPASDSRGEFMSYVAHRRETSVDGDDPYTAITLNGRMQMVPSFFYNYEVTDLRRDISAKPYRYVKNVPTLASDASTLYLSKWRAEWMTRKINSKDDGVNYMIMRLADLYLINAEANNELGNIADAKQMIIKVRERAFANSADASAPVEALGSKEEVLDFIQLERAKEFVGEGVRRWDLMRWGNLKDKLDQTYGQLRELREMTGPYSELSATLFYKDNGQNGFDIYGLNPEEYAAPSSEWKSKSSWLKSSCFNNFIDCMYDNTQSGETHVRQLMPIMNVIISNSRGQLTNEYGY